MRQALWFSHVADSARRVFGGGPGGELDLALGAFLGGGGRWLGGAAGRDLGRRVALDEFNLELAHAPDLRQTFAVFAPHVRRIAPAGPVLHRELQVSRSRGEPDAAPSPVSAPPVSGEGFPGSRAGEPWPDAMTSKAEPGERSPPDRPGRPGNRLTRWSNGEWLWSQERNLAPGSISGVCLVRKKRRCVIFYQIYECPVDTCRGVW